MRALLVIRDDAQATLGGDTIQLMKTAAVLRDRDTTVDVCSVKDLDHAPDCDVAHVFNIQTAEESWQAFEKLEARRVPVALSPIYWDMSEHWFDLARKDRRHWRILAALAGWRAACRLYLAWQRTRRRQSRRWQLQREMLQRATVVLPNATSEGEHVREAFELDASVRERIHVVPNGIDTALFDPAPRPSKWFRQKYGVQDFVLEVGALSPVKNQFGLIRALNDLPVPIVIIGQPTPIVPEYAVECRALAARRGNVLFIDRIPHDELPGIYALAAVHVLPSWRETPGLVSLEAAASGCRVVSTSIGSVKDYFGDFATYCHPADIPSIRTAVQTALARAPSSALREHVLANFTWARAGEATRHAYEAAVRAPAYVR